MMKRTWIRAFVTLFITAGAAALLGNEWGAAPWISISTGLAAGVALIALELTVGLLSGDKLVIVFMGLIVGLLLTLLIWTVIAGLPFAPDEAKPWVLASVGVVCCYLIVSVFLSKGDQIAPLQGLFKTTSAIKAASKILDSSVIIDGRIADILETDFMDGKFIIPRFVLQEVQYIADSQDPLRRQRGRRGLEVLQRVQQKLGHRAEIVETNYPHIKEVDEKLVEMGKQLNAKVVTNDYNLNKVAKLQGVEILNINDLSNAVKPVVLPGETMSVKVLKEGKEHGQGVAYLDDGTMIVVEGGRAVLGQIVDVVVTSVLQTAAGRMIFTKRHTNNN